MRAATITALLSSGIRFASKTGLDRWTELWRSNSAFSRLTVAARITAIALTLAVPLNLVIIVIIWHLSEAASEAQRAGLLYTARSVATAVDAKLDRYMALAEALARSPALRDDNLDTFEVEARRVLASSPDALVLVADPEGQLLINTAGQPGQRLALRDPIGLATGKRAFETHATILSDVYFNSVSQSWVITIDVPIFKNDRPFRTFAVAVMAQSFFRLLNDQHMPNDWRAAIIDHQGRIISRARGGVSDEGYIGQLASENWRNLMDQNGVFELIGREGEPVIAARIHSATGGWVVGIGIKKAAMQAATWYSIRWAIIIGGGFSVMSLAFAIAIARSIAGPINRLRNKASALLRGAVPSSPASGPPEIRELWQALQHSAAALRESEERFRGVFENAGTGIAIVDMQGRFLSCNPAYSAMLGYSAEELRQLNFANLVHPEDRETNLTENRRLLAQEIPSFEIQNRYVAKDGKTVWVHKHISLMHGAAGTPAQILALVTDITARKRTEQQVQMLMREVNHRSKNMLSLVQAVARQTIASNPEDFITRFGERIQALAAAQDLLVKNEWKGVDAGELTRSQLAHFSGLIGTRIELNGPPLFISASAAQTIGMALHELATNAGKYGALSNSTGRVAVDWSLNRAEMGAETFAIAWRESGGPPVTAPERQGFGSAVIGELAEMNLGAKVDLSFASAGLSWRLECAAGEIMDRSTKPGNPAPSSPRPGGQSRILVVEDEAIVALEIARVLKDARFKVLGPAGSVAKGLELISQKGCDAAVLDVNLGKETSEPIALELKKRGTPFVTLSGYSREQCPAVFGSAPALVKPLQPKLLIAEIRDCLQGTPGLHEL